MAEQRWWEQLHELEQSLEECKEAIRKELIVLPRWIQKILFFCYPFLRKEKEQDGV